jgi:ParB/RepB/Spo0J family partition protein
MKNIHLGHIKPSKTNPRKHFDKNALGQLSESIKKQGMLSPILVRKLSSGDYEIVAGERRYRAAKLAGLKEIPAIVRDLTDTEALEVQVVENLQREDVHPLEEAEGYEQLIRRSGYKTADDIAAKIGKSRSYVYSRMNLCALLPECRKMFYEGKLSASTALLIARMPADQQEPAAKDIIGESDNFWVDGPMSYREAKELIEGEYMLNLSDAVFDTKDPDLVKSAGNCEECLKRTGNEPDLFSDIQRTDVCTDPECFKTKKSRWKEKVLNDAEEKGKTVLSLGECEKIFTDYGYMKSNKYISLRDTCYDDIPAHRTYKEIHKIHKAITIRTMKRWVQDIKRRYPEIEKFF